MKEVNTPTKAKAQHFAYVSNQKEEEKQPESSCSVPVTTLIAIEIRINTSDVEAQDKESDLARESLERKDSETQFDLEKDSISIDRQEPKEKTKMVQDIRNRFIFKVLMILTLQFLISALFVGLTFLHDAKIREAIKDQPYIIIIPAVLSVIILMILTCKREYARRLPLNYILLFLFTCCMSYILAYLASFTKSYVLLMGTILTFTIVLGALSYAYKGESKFSKRKILIYQIVPLSVVLIGIGIFFPDMFVSALISSTVVVIFMLYLTFDLQRLLGKFEKKYTVDDYVLAALDIYIDIYLIFVELIKVIGGCTSD